MTDDLFYDEFDDLTSDEIDEIQGEIFDIESEGGIILNSNTKDPVRVYYFVGQYNDNNMDPDSIVIKSGDYRVQLDEDCVWVRTPTREFDLPLNMQLTDFLEIQSPVAIIVNKTNIGDMVDAVSNKTLKINSDSEAFQKRVQRLESLLVFS
jgi:hypothetical protein